MAKQQQHRDQWGEAAAQIVGVVAGAGAGTCIAIITSLLALNIHPLDDDLRRVTIGVAIALPLLIIASALAFLRVGLVVAYAIFTVGFLVIEWVLYYLLHHLDPVASMAFTFACLFSNLTFLLVGNRYLAHHRRGEAG